MKQEDLKLVNMYLDGELSGDALSTFEKRLASNPHLKGHLDRLEALEREAEVMEVYMAPDVSFSRKRKIPTRISPSRTISFLAGAALAAICILLVVGTGPGNKELDPVARSMETVRMIYYAPEAKSVAILGDFNDWSGEIPFRPRGDGNYWLLEIPVNPGEYRYVLVVDGQKRFGDPMADYVIDDDFGSKNSVVRIGF